jgi:hypothetical protein
VKENFFKCCPLKKLGLMKNNKKELPRYGDSSIKGFKDINNYCLARAIP